MLLDFFPPSVVRAASAPKPRLVENSRQRRRVCATVSPHGATRCARRLYDMAAHIAYVFIPSADRGYLNPSLLLCTHMIVGAKLHATRESECMMFVFLPAAHHYLRCASTVGDRTRTRIPIEIAVRKNHSQLNI